MPEVDIAAEIVKIGKAFEEFKVAHKKSIDEINAKGFVTADTEAKLGKIQDALDTAQEAKDIAERVATALNRPGKDIGRRSDGELTPAMQEYSDAFKGYMRGSSQNIDMYALADKAFVNAEGRKTLSVGVDPDGGYYVTPIVSDEIVRIANETTPMRALARTIPIGSDAFEFRQRLTGAVSGGWVSEAGARPVTDTQTVGTKTIPAHEQYAMPQATQKILDDASIDVEAWLAEEVAEIITNTENTAFITGTGAGQPRGLNTYADGTGINQVEQIASGAAANVTAEGLIDLQTALKEIYQGNASFLMNRLSVREVRKLRTDEGGAGQGPFLWQPGLVANEPPLLLGRPVFMGSDMPVATTGTNLAILYGDFRQAYFIIDRVGIRVLRDPFTAKPHVLFYTTKRTGGDLANGDAIKLQDINAA